jgi:hypothetical protein
MSFGGEDYAVWQLARRQLRFAKKRARSLHNSAVLATGHADYTVNLAILEQIHDVGHWRRIRDEAFKRM